MSQSELARACKVSPQAVQQWETGGGIRQKTLEQVAKALGVRPEALLFGTDVQAPELTSPDTHTKTGGGVAPPENFR